MFVWKPRQIICVRRGKQTKRSLGNPTEAASGKNAHSVCMRRGQRRSGTDWRNYLEIPAPKTHSHQPPIGCTLCIESNFSSGKFLFLLWRSLIPWASLKNKHTKLSLIKSPTTNGMKIIAINMTKG